jgi:hypothetical protein
MARTLTLACLSSASFQWWRSKVQLYDNVVFPGTHYTRANSLDAMRGAFTTKSFLDANIDRTSGIFLGGKLTYEDEDYRQAYTTVPLGLVVQFVRHDDSWTLKHWFKRSQASWNNIQKVSRAKLRLPWSCTRTFICLA